MHQDVKGLIFDIQRFCVHDGPGIRTTVFMKGCPLRCAWCHNPESQSSHRELFFTSQLCIGCRQCEETCPLHAGRQALARRASGSSECQLCFRCAEACPAGAIEGVGREMSVQEVMKELEKDRIFYEESGGGITVSGGEPMAQPAFTHALLHACTTGHLSTCVETSGFGSWDVFERSLPLVDLFLWDLKETDPDRHRLWTGIPLDPILRNLRSVDRLGARSHLRCVLVHGANMRPDHLQGIVEIYHGLQHCEGIELLAYHELGASKQARLGLCRQETGWRVPSQEDMEAAKRVLQEAGCQVSQPTSAGP